MHLAELPEEKPKLLSQDFDEDSYFKRNFKQELKTKNLCENSITVKTLS